MKFSDPDLVGPNVFPSKKNLGTFQMVFKKFVCSSTDFWLFESGCIKHEESVSSWIRYRDPILQCGECWLLSSSTDCSADRVDSYLALQTAQPTGLTVKYCRSGRVKREPLWQNNRFWKKIFIYHKIEYNFRKKIKYKLNLLTF